MAKASANADLVERFDSFYRNYYEEAISELAQQYPNDQRSLYVDYDDLYRFDIDLAEDYRTQPEQMQEYAEEALRQFDLPADVKLGRAHVRLRDLSDSVDIRDIRVHDDHIGRMVEVRGIVRKATDVRPKVVEAAFECQRCGTMTYIPQSDGSFQEPHECQGCERQGPFRVNHDQSEFVDSQQIRVQESPEGLRGGETPQHIDVNLEDDVTGKVTAGDHVAVVGVLHIEQMEQGQEKSAVFDLYMDGVSVQIEDEQFEDMEISDDDVRQILELSENPDIHQLMIDSVAPTIYGYDEEKFAMVLQLFSGVTKHLPDKSRIRGDMHLLLIGDPGTGKCLAGDTRVTLGDGREGLIRDLVESNLDDPKAVDDGVWDTVDLPVQSMAPNGSLGERRATKVWKRTAPDRMYRVRTTSGRELTVTPSHPLFVQSGGRPTAKRAEELSAGEFVAVAPNVLADGGVATARRSAALGADAVDWERIKSIDTVDSDEEWVYDLEVGDTHTYLSNGIVSHNSQMLSYIRKIAPRSVYTSGKGSSSAGLCVTGDTFVHTADGFRQIEELVTEDIDAPVEAETAAERTVSLYTLDRETDTIERRDSTYVWRMPEKSCRRIETGHGKTVEASLDTPVLTCGADGIEWTPVSAVERGDYVAVPRYDETTVDRREISVREYLELTNETVRLDNESVAFVRRRLREKYGTLSDAAAALDFTEDFVYDTLPNRYVPLEKVDVVLDGLGMTRADIGFERLMLRHEDSITLPETFDEDLSYLLGLVFGDGDISLDRRDGSRGTVQITNDDESVLRRAADVFAAQFDRHVEIERREDRAPCIRVTSATIARIFANAGMQSPNADLRLDPPLTTAAHADAFLRGLMDADGSVSNRKRGGPSIHLSTISEDLARQVQLMLETYGVRARTRERDRRGTSEPADGQTTESNHVQHFVEIYGADVDRYAERIGFEVKAKRAALRSIASDGGWRGDTLSVGAALAQDGGPSGAYDQNIYRGDNPGRGRARAMLDDHELDLGPAEPMVGTAVEADLRWDEVVATTDMGEKEVFDLTIPGTHNFVGNGVVTHNTAAAVRDDFGEGQQWTLEAGALVLADQGIAAVDELDKMRCVTGATLVHGVDGIERICDIAADEACDGVVESLPNGRTIRDIDDREVWTMTDDGRLVTRPVEAIHEYEAPTELSRVTLTTGERLTATDDHPFFVREDGERVERATADLAPGDWVYVPRALTAPQPDGGATTGTRQSSTNEPTDSNENGVSPALSAVLGYLAGDGNVYHDRAEGVDGIRFTHANEELLADFERAASDAFEDTPVRPPSDRRSSGVETGRVTGKAAAETVLDAGMNLEGYDGKRLPPAVTRSSRAAKAAFLRALADSEGTVGERAVTIVSSSYELLLGAKKLLLEFGVSGQIQTRTRSEGRDGYLLAVTDASALAAFRRHVGFTLSRKQRALDAAVDTVSGDRTTLDVIPNCGQSLSACRESLRLSQSECGIADSTYCDFEAENANVPFRAARRIVDAFETRLETARTDLARLEDADWERLAAVRDRYHVSQADLAAGSNYSQQQVSRLWGTDPALRRLVEQRLKSLVSSVSSTDIDRFRQLVHGDVKWRRVESIDPVSATIDDDEVRLLREELAEILGCEADEAVDRAKTLLATEPRFDDRSVIDATLTDHDISYATVAKDVGVAPSTVSRWMRGTVETDRLEEVRDTARERVERLREHVETLCNEVEHRTRPRVYDLTVADTHNFLANGMVVHNSEDRSAMHQALEQQEISVSKAGINATLKSRCSLLGAANPRYGRFDPYEPIGEQIDLEPALISRFDLIFTVQDKPDEEHDANLADHILNSNYAGELSTQREKYANTDFSDEEIAAVTEEVEPTIEPDLFRKYIAYAKRNCVPSMSEAAREQIKQFYVDLRARGTDEDAPVPITARKLEALVRLAEASARVRLSDTVTESDAERVVELVRSCLQDIGVDPETGEFDADVVETGTSKTQRDRIKNVKTLIEDIEGEYEEGAPVNEVLSRASEAGIDRSKAEQEIENLKKKGELYEPSLDHLRTT
jgi:replicative DNA helicase Mcm